MKKIIFRKSQKDGKQNLLSNANSIMMKGNSIGSSDKTEWIGGAMMSASGNGYSFADFCAELEVVDKEEGNRLRQKYIEKFVDRKHPSYKTQIATKHRFSDGYCYQGYLWDFLKNKTLIEKEKIEAKAKSSGLVYVFWDIHSCEKIVIKNYWKFEKDAVLKLPFSVLMEGQQFLPEDLYIFDEKMTWTFAITHEEIDGVSYCLKCGEI